MQAHMIGGKDQAECPASRGSLTASMKNRLAGPAFCIPRWSGSSFRKLRNPSALANFCASHSSKSSRRCCIVLFFFLLLRNLLVVDIRFHGLRRELRCLQAVIPQERMEEILYRAGIRLPSLG